MHIFLGLGWDEWGSVVAIITSVCFLANWILNKTVKDPLNHVSTRIDKFNKESMMFRQQSAEQINGLENRIIKAEGRLDGHDIEFKHLYEREAEKNEKN
ncbi:hypothetical protein [Lactiplantibacillus plantarum]|uniref:hypothetical protein n=1 Tax=Lactiplantibacillus plantarum TaxID=1590 RepID=UPI0026548AC6|nr:hypothetical protein [Lactiplantibacillus plantarum]MDN7044853.1 hypothetical protein [Lactiplantibacillus plantarum]